MNHEPECPVKANTAALMWMCRCDGLRAAYQRGREDAEKGVEKLAAEFGDSDWQLTVHASAVAHGIEMALAAVKGGEQV